MADLQEYIGQSIGDYRLLRLLGEGTFGTVYLAEHLHNHTSAAVKVLRFPLTSSNDFRAFLKEARTVRLRHPHIIPILDFDLSLDDLPYLVMAYADGGTLRDRHPKGSKLPNETIDTYVRQLASALQYAHDQRIIHRDVKPENMLVLGDGTVQLSDFGIARISEQTSLLSMNSLVGTPAYAAPEQNGGKPCPASDQYALAIVAYEWLVGRLPFEGKSHLAIMLQHRMDEPPPLQDICPGVSPQIEGVILKALAKDPEERFPTVTHFAGALHTALQEEVIPTQRLANQDENPSSPSLVVPVISSVAPYTEMILSGPPLVPAEPSLSSQPIPPSSSGVDIAGANKLPVASTGEGPPLSTQDKASPSSPNQITPMNTTTRDQFEAKALHQDVEAPPFLPERGQSLHPSAVAKNGHEKMIQRLPPLYDRFASALHISVISLQHNLLRLKPIIPLFTGIVLIFVILIAGFTTYLNLLSPQAVPPKPTPTAPARVIPTSTPTPQPPTPTPTPLPVAINHAIPAGQQLYGTLNPFSDCDSQGGHWTDNSPDRQVICKVDGSEIVNTSGHPTSINIDRLAGNQHPWPSQNYIVQVTINQNSKGDFGIDFQHDRTQGYLAYLINSSGHWTFDRYDPQGNVKYEFPSGTSSVATQLTLDIVVQGTKYTFYVNGATHNDSADTMTSYGDQFAGLAIGANADVTFSNFAIYALP